MMTHNASVNTAIIKQVITWRLYVDMPTRHAEQKVLLPLAYFIHKC